MGYTTEFSGEFALDKPLTIAQKQELEAFAEERHGGNTEAFAGYPGFWCQWVPNDDGTAIKWDGGEKFYSYVQWLQYIIDHFIKPWGLTLNGEVAWFGEEDDDLGKILVRENIITTLQGTVVYRTESN